MFKLLARFRPEPKGTLTQRIIWGKILGMLLGAIVFFAFVDFSSQDSVLFYLGVWGWYILFGAFIGLVGIFEKHPVLKFPLPSSLRGFMVGAGLFLIFYFLIQGSFAGISSFGIEFFDLSMDPFHKGLIFVLEGAFWGLVIDMALTQAFGQGKGLVKKL